MLGISFFIMYTVMFLNVDSQTDIFLSSTRLYMTILMVSPMALTMLFIMKHMYKNTRANLVITIFSVIVFVLSIIFLRNQTFVNDIQFMKAMIPHHSSAIMTSKNANLKDPEVIQLSRSIIRSQEREIVQMKAIIRRWEK